MRNFTKCDHECAGRPFNHTLGPPNYFVEREAQLLALAQYYGEGGAGLRVGLHPVWCCWVDAPAAATQRPHVHPWHAAPPPGRVHAGVAPQLPLLGAAAPRARPRAPGRVQVDGGAAHGRAAPGAAGQEALCT